MTDRTRSRIAVALGAGLLVLWGLVVCAGEGRAATLRASSETFWPVAQFSVSGIPVPGSPTQAVQADGSVLIFQVVPALVLPAAVSLRVTAGDGRVLDAVLPDGRPGPLVQYPAVACRADLNDDGGVGLDDVGIVFGQAARGARCSLP